MTDHRTVTVETLTAALNEAWTPDDVFVDDTDIWEMLAARVFAALPAAEPQHPDDGHEHRYTCIRCGVDATPAGPLDGRSVHAAWRDGMLAQGREVSPERMTWETLTDEDRALDDSIAARLTPAGPLDVEALEKAMESFAVAFDGYDVVALYDAPEVAAEYARLAATEPREDFADPTAVDHPLYADQALHPDTPEAPE